MKSNQRWAERKRRATEWKNGDAGQSHELLMAVYTACCQPV